MEGYKCFSCYRGVIPHRQVLVMGTIVIWGKRGGEKKRSTEKAVTPKPQMPAVGESCIYTSLLSLAADWYTCYRAAQS